MVFDRRERQIRHVLRRLAKQRLAMILQPGGIWVIENAVSDGDDTQVALSSCHLRGWAEPLGNAIPSGNLTPDGRLPTSGPLFDRTAHLYRLTDSGWSVVNRSQLWILITVFASVVSLLLGAIAVLATHH